MLSQLKSSGIRVGLISNCFSEEAEVIRESVLFPYFDEVCSLLLLRKIHFYTI